MKTPCLFLVLFALVFLVGCPTPQSYIRSTEIALENSGNLNANVDILASNYYKFISQDTQKQVTAGEMDEVTRTAVLGNVEEQVSTLKEQTIINGKFVALAHDWVHNKTLTIEEVLAAIQTVNQSAPEIQEFINKLKGK